MVRLLLAWFLLLNYLLVVGAGLGVERPGPPVVSVAHPYVHSGACQQDHYLLLDCFEHCNGEQDHGFSFRLKLPTGTGLHFLAQLKGLDVHCVAEAAPGPPGAAPWLRAARPPARRSAAVAAGVGGRPYPPPPPG